MGGGGALPRPHQAVGAQAAGVQGAGHDGADAVGAEAARLARPARTEPVSRRPGSCSQALSAQPLVAEPELGTTKDAGGAASSLTTLATPRLASGMGAPVVGEHGAVDGGLGWLARQGPPDQQVCHEAGCGSRQVVAPEVGIRLPGQLLQPAHPARPGSAHGTWLPSMGQGVWS